MITIILKPNINHEEKKTGFLTLTIQEQNSTIKL